MELFALAAAVGMSLSVLLLRNEKRKQKAGKTPKHRSRYRDVAHDISGA
jgi:hypothetical protein